MPALPTLVIEASDGSTKATVDCISAARHQTLVEMWNATATLDRSEWLNAASNLDEVNDRLRIERGDGSTLFEGRFANDVRDGNTIVVSVSSYEQDAIDAEPTQGRVIYTNVSDSSVADDAITAVSSLSPGALETGASSVSFTFANANRSKVIRDAAEPAGQDVRYNADRTVDFLNRLGADKSSITISSANQNIVDELSVEDNSRDPVTHIKGLGAQQGGKQVRATATVPSYSSGRKVWREYENTDIMQVDRMQAIVDRLASEFDNEQRRLLVTATLLDVDVQIGDRITVDLPLHDISRLLRITQLTERLTNEGQRYEVTLTNRDVERGGSRKRRDDLSRFNRGDQGFVDRDQVNSGWNPAGDGTPQTLEIPNWPDDVVREDEVTLTVQGRAWRSPVTDTGHSHGYTTPSHSHGFSVPDHSHDFSIDSDTTIDVLPGGIADSTGNITVTTIDDSSWTSLLTLDVTDAFWVTVQILPYEPNGNITDIDIRAEDSDGNHYPQTPSGNYTDLKIDTSPMASWSPTIPVSSSGGSLSTSGITQGGDLDIQAQISSGPTSEDLYYSFAAVTAGIPTFNVAQTSTTDAGGFTSDTTDSGGGSSDTTDAQAALEPQIIDTFNGNQYYPSDVEIDVNGTTVTTVTGDSTADWQTDVDLAGQLSAGQNTITATPTTTRGSVNLILYSELFRSGGPAP